MKILAALDNSDFAFKALSEAVAVAKRENAELTIFSAYSNVWQLEEIPAQTLEILKQQADELVLRGKAIAEKEGTSACTVTESGYSPADSIVNYAEQNHFDLIVVGHKSRTGLSRLLIGSVAAKVVTYAPCSVLVVR